jgi:hypothetical protein
MSVMNTIGHTRAAKFARVHASDARFADWQVFFNKSLVREGEMFLFVCLFVSV